MAAAPAEKMVSEDANGVPDGSEKEDNVLLEEKDEESDAASRNGRSHEIKVPDLPLWCTSGPSQLGGYIEM